MKVLTGDELFVRLETEGFSDDFETLLHAAAQNAIPDTPEAFQDLVNELRRVGVKNSSDFKRTRMYPKRTSDPDDKLDTIYRALPKLPLDNNRYIGRNICRIDYIENKKHSDAFYSMKESFLLSEIDAEECFMFHGTNDCNIDSILGNNFDANFNPTHKVKGSAYGNGIYFSEFPSVGLSYGTLILCRVLTGRVQMFKAGAPQEIPDQFDSRKVAAAGATDHSAIHVIKNPDQILPYCVIILQDVKDQHVSTANNATIQALSKNPMRNQAPAGPSISAPLATATVAPTAGASAIAAAAALPGPPPLRRSKRLVISKVMADFIGQPNLEYRECVRFVKDYIEQKDLSSPQNRTLFVPDQALEKFFGAGIFRITSVPKVVRQYFNY